MKWNAMLAQAVLLMIVMLGSGCAGSSSSNATTQGPPGTAAKGSTAKRPAEGSHADRTYIDTSARLLEYKVIYVAPPTMDTTAERDEKVSDFLRQLEITIRSSGEGSLRGTGKFELVTTNEQEAKAKGKYLVFHNDVLVHFGSTAARMIVGMGAGRSKLIVVASLEDPSTNNILLKYTGWGGSVAGFGSQILSKMQGDAVSIESYFAGLVPKVSS